MKTTMRKTMIIFTLILSGVFLLSSSCEVNGEKGSGKVAREERSLPVFSSIDIGGAFDVFLSQGNTQSVIVEADDNILPLIKTEVVNGRLRVDVKKPINHPTVLKLFITVPTLEDIEVSGAVDLQTQTRFTVPAMRISLSGASDSKLDIAVDKLDIRSSGGSNLKLTGSAGEVKMNVSGAVDVEAFDLQTGRFFLDISGAGEADINVKDELTADISGAATVRYRGNPGKVYTDVSGAGSVKRAE